ncbi:MAG: MarR family transcriptional regulator [Clostridiales bacterium]|jgi:DNA-binding MarR family transcriptional regulator|nr:MarR family transcriptional regulator [Clostridiales bacterium]
MEKEHDAAEHDIHRAEGSDEETLARQNLFRRILETLDNNASINLQTSFWLNELMRLHGINHTTYRMLRFISRHPEGVEPSVVADYLVILRQTVTNMSDELEKSGLITRKPHPTDRRRILLFLTESGADLTNALIDEMDSLQRNVFNHFTIEEMEQYISIRHRIIAHTEEEIKKLYEALR